MAQLQSSVSEINFYLWALSPHDGGYKIVGYVDCKWKNNKKIYSQSEKLIYYDGKIAKSKNESYVLNNVDPVWKDYLLSQGMDVFGIKV